MWAFVVLYIRVLPVLTRFFRPILSFRGGAGTYIRVRRLASGRNDNNRKSGARGRERESWNKKRLCICSRHGKYIVQNASYPSHLRIHKASDNDVDLDTDVFSTGRPSRTKLGSSHPLPQGCIYIFIPPPLRETELCPSLSFILRRIFPSPSFTTPFQPIPPPTGSRTSYPLDFYSLESSLLPALTLLCAPYYFFLLLPGWLSSRHVAHKLRNLSKAFLVKTLIILYNQPKFTPRSM